MINYTNIINRYDDMIYESSPVSLNEFISNKYNNVHNELYEDALNKYIYSLIDNIIDSNVIVEICLLFKEIYMSGNYNISYYEQIINLLSELSINENLFVKDIYNETLNTFTNIINSINNDSVNDVILNINNYLGTNNVIIDNDNEKYNDYAWYINFDNIKISYSNSKWIIVGNNINEDILLSIKDINNDSSQLINNYKSIIYKLYKRYHKIIEIKNKEYWMASSIRIIDKIPPFKRQFINLDKYWNYTNNKSEINELKITNENILDSEVIDINYVNGIATLYSKSNDLTYKVPFRYLNENTNISDDITLASTFNFNK